MDNNKQKFGSLYKSKNTNNNVFSNNSSNLFMSNSINPILTNENSLIEPDNQKFINDVDSALIMENVDKTAKNKVVKINLKINTLEKHLIQIKEELKVLELFNLDKDAQRRNELTKLKDNIILQINNLKAENHKFGVIYLLSAYTNNKISLDNLKYLWSYIVEYLDKYYKLLIDYIKDNRKIANLFTKFRL